MGLMGCRGHMGIAGKFLLRLSCARFGALGRRAGWQGRGHGSGGSHHRLHPGTVVSLTGVPGSGTAVPVSKLPSACWAARGHRAEGRRMPEGAGAAQPPNASIADGRGSGGVPGRLPPVGQQGRGGTEVGRRWWRASSANPNLIFPGPTPVSMETAGSRNGNQNPEMRSLELPFAFLDSRSPWPRDAGWVLTTGHPRCSHHAGVRGRPVSAARGVGVLLCPCTLWHPCMVHGTWGCAWCAQQGCAVGRGYRGQGVPRAGATAGRDIAGSTVRGQVQTTSAHICASRWCTRVGV